MTNPRLRAIDNGSMESWELREWYGEYLDACNRHDLEAIRACVDPSVRRAHLPGGVESWVADLAELFHGFPDWRWKRIQLIVEDDRIAVHLRGSGTHTGDYRGIPSTRRRVNVAEFAMYRVVNGRIAEAISTSDLELRAQLGAVGD